MPVFVTRNFWKYTESGDISRVALNQNTVHSKKEFLFKDFHGRWNAGGALSGFDCSSSTESSRAHFAEVVQKVKEEEKTMMCVVHYRMRTKLSVFYSVVLHCLWLTQRSAAREFMKSSRLDDAYEQLRKTVTSSVTAAAPITREVRYRHPHYVKLLVYTWLEFEYF